MILSEQEEQRRKSREEIIELGIDPYPSCKLTRRF